MFSIEIGIADSGTRQPNLRDLPIRSGDFARAETNPAAKTRKQPMIVDLPELLGPTATLKGPRVTEKSRNDLTFRSRTLETVASSRIRALLNTRTAK